MKITFDHAMQFKIALKDVRPPIWRRIQVPCDYSFWDLHVAIQDAMGWLDCHLHEFRMAGKDMFGETLRFGIPDEEISMDDPTFPGWDFPIAAFFTLTSRRATYEYDFGDSWQHSLLLEKILPRDKSQTYPVCLAGRRACPPEDCGGTSGYDRLLEALSDPEDPERESYLEWLGGPWDANRFKPSDVVFEDPDQRWSRAFDWGE